MLSKSLTVTNLLRHTEHQQIILRSQETNMMKEYNEEHDSYRQFLITGRNSDRKHEMKQDSVALQQQKVLALHYHEMH